MAVTLDPSEAALRAPDAAALAFKLDDLQMIDEKVHLGTVVLDVPLEGVGVGGLEHAAIQAERIDDLCRHIGAPLPDLFGDASDSMWIISAPASKQARARSTI